MGVQVVEKVEGRDHLTGMMQIVEPRLQRRSVIGIAGEAVRNQFDLLVGSIVEREQARGRLDQAFDRIVVVEIDLTSLRMLSVFADSWKSMTAMELP